MIDDLKLLYNAEKQFEKALPKLMKSAYSKELQFILQNHLTETGHQINRLEEISQMLGKSFSGKKSKEMQYLIEDGKEVSDTDVEKGFKDFVLIAVLQK